MYLGVDGPTGKPLDNALKSIIAHEEAIAAWNKKLADERRTSKVPDWIPKELVYEPKPIVKVPEKFQPSVFALPRPNLVPRNSSQLTVHEKWAMSRELFISTPTDEAREAAYDLMMSYVTDTNPPYAEDDFGMPTPAVQDYVGHLPVVSAQGWMWVVIAISFVIIIALMGLALV